MLGYVDPSGGFVFVQQGGYLWGILLGLLGSVLFFLKFFFSSRKRSLLVFIILAAGAVFGGMFFMRPRAYPKKVIVLGIDAMDAPLTEQFMREGRLPACLALTRQGTYSRLATTNPAESAVAWTSFATGLTPGAHGIFDFVMRSPEDYVPYLSLNEIVSGGKQVHIRRKGTPFWKVLSDQRIPCALYFTPNTFPPEPVYGVMLSGMGTPDVTGTMGKYSFYTAQKLTDEDRGSRGRIIGVNPERGKITAVLYGPRLRVKDTETEAAIPFTIAIVPSERSVRIKLQGKSLVLKEKAWSSWQEVSFRLGALKRMRGILRFWLKSVQPFELYVTPINFNPRHAFFPVSYPRGFSGQLAGHVGLYYTQGMPHDTWALSENRLDEKAFLEQVDTILSEKERILNEALRRFRGGALFFYFDTLDAVQHMFWRYQDPQHPLYERNAAYQDTIVRYYEKIDRIIGEVIQRADKDTTLLVISDHGFTSFRKSVHLNRWLLENGYLVLQEHLTEGGELFKGIDWSRTKAYALGFGGIYLNRAGREYYGIVPESDAQRLKQDIVKKLSVLKDPDTGAPVIHKVYTQEEAFNGASVRDVPDILVGFNAGYRASWQTALGGVPVKLIEANTRKWSGDHLVDPALVPGVVFVNKKAPLESPSMIDIAPTLLGLFQSDKPGLMQGKVLFKDEKK